MIPPKCRICGTREHNHRCQGGTPAQRVAERDRQRREVMETQRAGSSGDDGRPAALTPPGSPPKPPDQIAKSPANRRRWHEDSDSAGEPTEIADYVKKPARFYAPPGQCLYCDRRRAAARKSMRSVRERGTDA